MSSPEARHGRSSSILDRNYGRCLGGHHRTEAPCSALTAKGHVENVSRDMPMERQEDSGHMYNQAGVDALDAVRAVVASFGAPLVFRKIYGILNAMEMHVEETPYSVDALQHLGKALEATARLYRINQQQSTTLTRALATFLRTAAKL
jgi:hypothetical protein